MKRALVLEALALSGCGYRGALAPVSPEAIELGRTFWLFFWTSWVVFGLVLLVTVVACVRGARRLSPSVADGKPSPDPNLERKLRKWVTASTVTTVIILFGLLIASVASGRRLSELEVEAPLHVHVTAHQWWWEIRYPGDKPADLLVTANELHVPVGRPVELELESADVIHSFWVPRITGKRDLIPSHVNGLLFRVDEPGTYPGRCAEFCGLEHARMDLAVVAELPGAFERWLSAQRRPAREPTTELAARGALVVTRGACATCHNVSGTPAAASNGPDLTHFASRSLLAAGAAPMTRAGLTGWVADPARFKPGTHMPAIGLAPDDLSAAVEYLEGLR
ncbi:MAG TPA: cytochrome c oxidase subunit II [Polyangiaceae bacterium]|nr:cytochrome c oxidase subunit II [Polyangiaceae bacterium]